MSSIEYHFKDYLNSTYINKIKDELRFNDVNVVEKFIMDYEILFHILKEIPDSIIKGGMSVPLHIPEMGVRRLSEDIDIVTQLSEAQVKSAMEKVGRATNGLFTIPESYKPAKPRKSLPLLAYYVSYSSSVGNPKPEVQVDIFYDFKDNIPTKLINSETELMNFKLNYPIKVFDKGSLIGDKITTLGFNTIGLPKDRRSDTVKHIYDIALLSRLIEDKTAVEVLMGVYKKTASYENSFNETKFSDESIIDDIYASIKSLLIQGTGYSLESSHKGRYASFKQQLLRNNNSYQISNHINDLLLIQLLTSHLLLLVHNKITPLQFIDNLHNDLSELKSITLQNAIEKGISRKQMIQSFNTNNGKRFINTLPQAEQVFLFKKIEELKL